MAKDYREIPPPFELEGMLYSTLGRLVLIGQILSFKCNNVKETQTEYHFPYKTRQTILHLCISVFLSWVHV